MTPQIPILAITGSVGKTTTKDFAATLLSGKKKVGKTPRSYNSQRTLPLNIRNLDGDEEPRSRDGDERGGEIARLTEIATPEVAVITKIALAHVALFPEWFDRHRAGEAEICANPKTRAVCRRCELCRI